MKNLVLLSMIVFGALGLSASELKSAALLNKISLSLTGKAASISDQQEIARLSNQNEIQIFINSRIDRYMKTEEYSQKLTFKLFELFRFSPSDSARYSGAYPDFKTLKPYSTSILFDSLTKQNLSWDNILLERRYTLTSGYGIPDSSQDQLNDFSFFKNIIDVGLNSQSQSKSIQFSPDDLRIAGAITTPTFFTRYVNTAVNKNRKRAAALFRIFLCDPMTASISETKGIENSTYELLYPKTGSDKNAATGMTEAEVRAVLNRNDQIHGTRKDCMACHYKLDPMGKVFLSSPTLLGSFPSPGSLIYKNKAGQVVNIPVKGLSQLALAITKQPEYEMCQIKHLWNWYIGQDVPISDERMAQLRSSFNQSNRRTNDFIKSLVTSKEFATRLTPNEVREVISDVRAVLKKCQTCHDSDSEYLGVDLTKWPLGLNQADPKSDSKFWTQRIAEELDLKNNGLNRKMPPPPAKGGFIPSRQELQLINKWLNLGAPMENGQLQRDKL